MNSIFKLKLSSLKITCKIPGILFNCSASNKFSSFPHQAYINGQWLQSHNGHTFEVKNPFNDDIIASVPDLCDSDISIAIKGAHETFQIWKCLSPQKRALILHQWHKQLLCHEESLATLLTQEQGKPISEARAEVKYAASYFKWFAEEAERIYGEVLQSRASSRKGIITRYPTGVIFILTPWNFPIAMIARKAAAALAAGCTCIVKPSEETPLSALALADLSQKSGLPSGAFNVVTASTDRTPNAVSYLINHSLISGVSFTGSTEVGRIIYKHCANGIKRVSLELGGNAPFIVFSTANLDNAVEGFFASKFRNMGQTCVSSNRLLVEKTVFNQFVAKLEIAMQRIVVGDGMKPEVTQGPLINFKHVEMVSKKIEDAISKGAKLHIGGSQHILRGNFFQPTLLTNVNTEMDVFREEIFGPVVAVISFSNESEAIQLSNMTSKGLASYLYSNDFGQVWRVADALEAGMVGVNTGMISSVEVPFGGVKESGFGREGSHHGTDEFLYMKYICMDGIY